MALTLLGETEQAPPQIVACSSLQEVAQEGHGQLEHSGYVCDPIPCTSTGVIVAHKDPSGGCTLEIPLRDLKPKHDSSLFCAIPPTCVSQVYFSLQLTPLEDKRGYRFMRRILGAEQCRAHPDHLLPQELSGLVVYRPGSRKQVVATNIFNLLQDGFWETIEKRGEASPMKTGCIPDRG